MTRTADYLKLWWQALVHPGKAGLLIHEQSTPRGFTRMLAFLIVALYAIYGTSMGLFLGPFPALVSAVKMPFLYALSLIVCYSSLYVLNGLLGPRLSRKQCLQLLLMAVSANAIALASYAPFSYFFTLTSSNEAYEFLVLMHVGVFAAAGVISIIEVTLLFRAVAACKGIRLRPSFVFGWALLYGIVGTQMAWVLRPWIGASEVEYQIIRPLEGSFIESVWKLLSNI